MAPSARLSATIAAFSCADHLRRRSTPVITSTRRGRAVVDTSLVSSLRSTLWSKRCLLMGRHHARAYLSRNVGAGHRLQLASTLRRSTMLRTCVSDVAVTDDAHENKFASPG